MMSADLAVAVVCIAIAAGALFIAKVSSLPRKSLPFILGALLGAIGYALLRRWQMQNLLADFKRQEEELKKKEEELSQLKKDYNLAQEELRPIRAELERKRAAYEKSLLFLKARNQEEKKRIDRLNGEALHHEFWEAFGSELQ